MFIKRLFNSHCSTLPPVPDIKAARVVLTALFTLSVLSVTPGLVSQAAPPSPTPTNANTSDDAISYVALGGHPLGDGPHLSALSAENQAGNPDAVPHIHTLADTVAPTSTVHTLPMTTTSPTFVLAWSGSDEGSGISAYDVQVRDGADGTWQDWLMDTTETSATFVGRAGHTYYFRCRAYDLASNIEDWPQDDGDTHTYIEGHQVFLPLMSRSATPSKPTATPWAGWEDEVIAMTNQERANRGLPPLLKDDRLTIAAEGHSLDMALNGFFDHTGSDGSLPWDRGSRQGYNWWTYGENIAAGVGLCTDQGPSTVMDVWMNSPDHRDNILNPDYEDIGVGFVYDPQSTYTCYWTVNFGAELD
jgi:uncharacterized protein YkwD